MTKVSVAAPLAGGGQCSVASRVLSRRARTADDNHLIRNFPIGSGLGPSSAVFAVSLFVCLFHSFFLFFFSHIFYICIYSFASC